MIIKKNQTCCEKFLPGTVIFVEDVTRDREVSDILGDVTAVDLGEVLGDDHATVTSDTVLLPDSTYTDIDDTFLM